jgi:hypothetical protein
MSVRRSSGGNALALAVATVLSAGVVEGQHSSSAAQPAEALESIYVVRSWRESRVTPTDFCTAARTGVSGATVEDRYTFRSVETQPEGLSHGFIGGHLTANTVNSRQPLGGMTDPAGYTQSSIATVRLWRRR